MASPLMIAIGLHYHTRQGDYGKGAGDNNFDAPAVKEAIQMFVNGGLLKEPAVNAGAMYEGTDGLRIWCEALCDVRWPVQVWIMPKNETV